MVTGASADPMAMSGSGPACSRSFTGIFAGGADFSSGNSPDLEDQR